MSIWSWFKSLTTLKEENWSLRDKVVELRSTIVKQERTITERATELARCEVEGARYKAALVKCRDFLECAQRGDTMTHSQTRELFIEITTELEGRAWYLRG